MKTDFTAPPWWARLMKRLQSLGQPIAVHSLRHGAEGLAVTTAYAGGEVRRVEMTWAEVDEALAFKRDCFTVDLICLAFGNKDGTVEINEEMPEWDNIVKALPHYLPGCMPEETWFRQVAHPAFATNPVHIFVRS